MTSGLDPQRGFDHGAFTVMHTMYREADMTLVQRSLRGDDDPSAHLDDGRRDAERDRSDASAVFGRWLVHNPAARSSRPP